MRREELDYHLPPELIAQRPLETHDVSRLLLVRRAEGAIEHLAFRDVASLLDPGDLLVVNDTRVLPARLLGHKPSGGQVEVLLLRELEPDAWEALLRPGRRLRLGALVLFEGLAATCDQRLGDGRWRVLFDPPGRLRERLPHIGRMPLPPYIRERLDDPERYQTVYARDEGSAAAPTAGLHFTPRVFAALAERGVGRASVTLHVGLDTFRPVQTEIVEDHPIHTEAWSLPDETIEAVAAARMARGRVVAVGTTSVRVLETVAREPDNARSGWTRLFITPGFEFRSVDALLTNFHLPGTTLFALVCAFAGTELMRRAYAEAVSERYRLLSFGDAMLIL